MMLIARFVLVCLVVVLPVMAIETETTVDHCPNPRVDCNPTKLGAKAIIIISSIINIFLVVPAIVRVLRLEKRNHSEDDTLFWWHLSLSSGGFFAWVCYFWDCSSAEFSTFCIFAVSLLLAVIYFILVVCATVATSGDTGDWRLYLMGIVPVSLWTVEGALRARVSTSAVGWTGCAVISLAQSFRIASTNYRVNSGDEPCWLSVRTWYGVLSAVGAIGGGLWLINPQLCYSLEYKVTCYAVGLLRSWETVQWISRPVARALSKIEGKMDERR